MSDTYMLELGALDVGREQRRLGWLEAACADLLRGGGTRGDRAAEPVLEWPARRVRGDEGGEQEVAAADARDNLKRGRRGAVPPRLPALAQAGEAAALVRDQHVPGAELGDVLERERE